MFRSVWCLCMNCRAFVTLTWIWRFSFRQIVCNLLLTRLKNSVYLFFRWGHWNSKWLSHLFRVTQLVRVKAEIEPNFKNPCFFHSANTVALFIRCLLQSGHLEPTVILVFFYLNNQFLFLSSILEFPLIFFKLLSWLPHEWREIQIYF